MQEAAPPLCDSHVTARRPDASANVRNAAEAAAFPCDGPERAHEWGLRLSRCRCSSSGTTPFDAEMARGSPALPKKRPVAATEFRHGNAHIEIAAASRRCVPQSGARGRRSAASRDDAHMTCHMHGSRSRCLCAPTGGLRGPRQRGERSLRGWLRVLACTQGAGRVAPQGARRL